MTTLGQATPGAATLRSFYQVLVNTLVANVTTSYLWFALTFWAYLETRSVLATAIIGGSYMLLVAVLGVVFGAIVDHMRKKSVMVLSSVITLATYLLAGALYLAFDESVLIDWGGPWFWVFAGVILIGGVVENLRNIALSTTVTLLVPADGRDKANGLVGTVQGRRFHGDERLLGSVDRAARDGVDGRDRDRRDGRCIRPPAVRLDPRAPGRARSEMPPRSGSRSAA